MAEQSSTQFDKPVPAVEIRLEDGKAYGTTNEFGVEIILLTKRTWVDTGTMMETMRKMLKSQDTRIKQLLEQNKDLQTTNGDLAERLDSLRANHRKLVASQVEQQIADLGYPFTGSNTPTDDHVSSITGHTKDPTS
jgi:hypothetical protein